MKIFIDSANLTDLEDGLKRGFAQGITTNPSLLAKEPRASFEGHIRKIIDLIQAHQPGIHLSVEVFSRETEQIVQQAESFVRLFGYPEMSIKVQVGWNELETVSRLSKKGISVNCTACMTVTQAMMAARAGARYVSLFWGRIRDAGTDQMMSAQRDELTGRAVLDGHDFDPATVVRHTRQLLDQSGMKCEIIVGSIRSVVDIRDAALAGAHIVTIPPKFFKDMVSHYKTTQVIDQFLTDFQGWMSQEPVATTSESR